MEKFMRARSNSGADDLVVYCLGKILVKEEVAPKEKHVVNLLSNVRTNDDVYRFFINLAKHKGVKENYIVIWKGLGLSHKLLQVGSEKVFSAIVEKHEDTFDYFRRLCVHETSLYAKSAAVLVQMLLAKIAFHKKYPEFQGNLTSATPPRDIVQTHGVGILAAILELLQLNIVCASVVLSMADTVVTVASFNGNSRRLRKRNQELAKQTCLLWPLVSVIQEIVSLYEMSVRLIDHISQNTGDTMIDSSYRLFSAQHRKVYHVFEDARSVPYLASKVYTLNLSKSPPELVKGETFSMPTRINPLPSEDELGDPSSKSMSLSPLPLRKRQNNTSSTTSSLSVPRKGSAVDTQQDSDVQTAIIASLREEVRKLRAGVIDVDPNTVAEIQMDGIKMGEKEVLALRQEKQETEDALDEALDEMVRLRAAVRSLEQGLEDETHGKATAISELEERIIAYEQEIESLKSHMDTMVNVMEDKDKTFDDVRKEFVSLEDNHHALQTQLSVLTSQLSEKTVEVARALQMVEENKEQQSETESELDTVKVMHSKIAEELKVTQVELESLKDEKLILTDRIVQLKQEAEGDVRERKALEEAIAAAESKYDEASEQLLQSMQRELNAKTALQNANQEFDDMMSQKTAASTLVDELEVKVSHLEGTVEVLHKQAADAKSDTETRIQELEAMLEKSQLKLVDASAQDEMASEQITKLHTEAAEFRKKIRELEDSVSETNNTLSTTQVSLFTIEGERGSLRERVHELESELSTVLAQKRDEVASLTSKINEMQQTLESKEREQEQTRSSLENKITTLEDVFSHAEQEWKQKQSMLEAKVVSTTDMLKSQKERLEGQVNVAKEQLVAHKAVSQAQVETLKVEKARALQEQSTTSNQNITTILMKPFPGRLCSIGGLIDSTVDVVSLLQSRHRETSFDGLSDSIFQEKAVQLKMFTELLHTCMVQMQDSDNDAEKVDKMCNGLHTLTSTLINNIVTGAGSDDEFNEAKQSMLSLLDETKNVHQELEKNSEKRAHNLQSQMEDASKSVGNAVTRISDLLSSAQESLEERTLNVNQAILEQSMALMHHIQKLIASSSELQAEIVEMETKSGKKTSLAQFYKRNSRWVDGLVSAARAVGAAATVLVDTADRAFSGHGKFEEIMVCGQEITASTAQLVSASRVKANQGSEKKHELEKMSKEVYTATQALIEAVRNACQKANEAQSAQDYLSLTLTQARRLQMDSQVRVKELEYALLKEQERLRQIRKAQYRLAEDNPVSKKRMSISSHTET
eukprot:m.5393 g.5393  ORF g.5393 m.5393 type:complete len:1269 (-) comp2395_c0_seq1:55-3861(-)